MLEFIRALLNKSFKSWTVVAGLLVVILTSVPDLFQTVIDTVGADSPALTAKLTALILIVARLKGIVLPILQGLLAKDEPK